MKPSCFEEAQDLAWRYTGHFLLNCYCREIAAPNGLLHSLNEKGRQLLVADFPFLARRVSIRIQASSITGNARYLSLPRIARLSKDDGAACFPEQLTWRDLPALIVAELCRRFELENQPELLAQIDSSRQVLTRILDHHLTEHYPTGVKTGGYMDSETALIFGHTFHPAPKSRYGWSEQELTRYSPEFHAAFPLHCFAVAPHYVRLLGVERADLKELFREFAAPADVFPTEWQLVPCHPWQAEYLLSKNAVKNAVEAGNLEYLGARGPAFRPTASVRTLFNQRFPYFVKTSLSLRITNSVRKNAWYELESAVALTQLLQPVADRLAKRFRGFSLLAEPVAVTVDLPGLQTEERLDLQSHFGIILRDNPFYESNIHAVLAGTVFSDDAHGQSKAAELIRRFRAQHPGMDEASAAVRWFERYIQHLLPPVLNAFFEYGVAFEPHLQNVLLKLDGPAASGIILRDMEGTKLDRSRWPDEALPHASDNAKASVRHDQNTAWQRVVYCLFVNNLCQAVFHCGRGLESETLLWNVVRRALEDYIEKYSGALCRKLAGSLLAGADLPGKANLITRFTREADSRAYYVDVANPLARSFAPARSETCASGIVST